MNWSSGISWAAAFKGFSEPAADDDDRGNMGTAFGLDASIALSDEDRRAGAPSVPPSALPWEHRLTRRSGL